MPSFLSTDNWLTRRVGAGLFGWWTSMMGGSIGYTGAPVSRVDEVSTHDRWHFKDWPSNWVVKKADGCGGSYGKLTLKVTETYTYVFQEALYSSDSTVYAATAIGPWGSFNNVNDSYCFSAGDDHTYDSWTLYWNNDIGGGDYQRVQYDYTLGAGYTTTDLGVGTEITTGQAFPVSDPQYTAYGSITGTKVTPSALLANYGMETVTTTNVYAGFHKPGASSWNRTSAAGINNYDGGIGYTWDCLGPYPGITTGGDNRPATVLWDESWTATGIVEKLTTSLRWAYDPQTSVGCKWWKDAQVQVKVTYKKAAITKTDGPNGVFLSLGSWSSGGDWTTTLTLHDQYTEQYVSASQAMPSAQGYLYMVDDVEVLSVTLP